MFYSSPPTARQAKTKADNANKNALIPARLLVSYNLGRVDENFWKRVLVKKENIDDAFRKLCSLC